MPSKGNRQETANFGQGRDKGYNEKYPSFIASLISAWVYTGYGFNQFLIFLSMLSEAGRT